MTEKSSVQAQHLTFQVPPGVSGFELTMKVLEMLTKEYEAEVIEVDMRADEGSILLSMPGYHAGG